MFIAAMLAQRPEAPKLELLQLEAVDSTRGSASGWPALIGAGSPKVFRTASCSATIRPVALACDMQLLLQNLLGSTYRG